MEHSTLNNVVIGKEHGEVRSVLISYESDINLKTAIRQTIKGYTNTKLTDKILGTEYHIVMGLLGNNLLALKEYNNVLFVPSFKNSKFPSLLDANYKVQMSNASQHMIPIINAYYETTPNVYVAYPVEHTSLYNDLHIQFDCGVVESNKMYSMGVEDYTVTNIPEGVKFDCVYLAGHDIDEGVTFSAEDIKSDFASVCTDDFDLIDDYQDHNLRLEVHRNNETPSVPDRLTGTQKDIREELSYISTNTIRSDGWNLEVWQTVSKRLSDLLDKTIKVY